MWCPKCGNEISDLAVLCPYCKSMITTAPANQTKKPRKTHRAKAEKRGGSTKKALLIVLIILAVFLVAVITLTVLAHGGIGASSGETGRMNVKDFEYSSSYDDYDDYDEYEEYGDSDIPWAVPMPDVGRGQWNEFEKVQLCCGGKAPGIRIIISDGLRFWQHPYNKKQALQIATPASFCIQVYLKVL